MVLEDANNLDIQTIDAADANSTCGNIRNIFEEIWQFKLAYLLYLKGINFRKKILKFVFNFRESTTC